MMKREKTDRGIIIASIVADTTALIAKCLIIVVIIKICV